MHLSNTNKDTRRGSLGGRSANALKKENDKK